MNSRTVLAIHGDAIYTSNVPPWARPVAPGGGARPRNRADKPADIGGDMGQEQLWITRVDGQDCAEDRTDRQAQRG